jgi:hypothetical protein
VLRWPASGRHSSSLESTAIAPRGEGILVTQERVAGTAGPDECWQLAIPICTPSGAGAAGGAGLLSPWCACCCSSAASASRANGSTCDGCFVSHSTSSSTFPWWEAIREGRTSTGTSLSLETEPRNVRVSVLNVSPVLDGWDKPKSVIATFEDVTELERKKAALERALVDLEKSRAEIRLHNEGLQACQCQPRPRDRR